MEPIYLKKDIVWSWKNPKESNKTGTWLWSW